VACLAACVYFYARENILISLGADLSSQFASGVFEWLLALCAVWHSAIVRTNGRTQQLPTARLAVHLTALTRSNWRHAEHKEQMSNANTPAHTCSGRSINHNYMRARDLICSRTLNKHRMNKTRTEGDVSLLKKGPGARVSSEGSEV
jgi:hypothetical protein